MNTQKWMGFKIVFILLCLLLGQRLTSGARAREYSGAAQLAEYQSYLPLMIRQVFVESTGELDPSFGEDGVVFTDFSYMDTSGASDVAVQPDGKIVAAGSSDIGDGDYADFAVARYHQDGSLDTSFDEDGMVLLNITQHDNPHAVALQTDGKIVAGGSSSSDIQDIVLVRYNPDGSLDPSFGDAGIVLTDFGDFDMLNDLVILPDGKVLAAGAAAFLAGEEYHFIFALARYLPDGSLDSSFDGDGKVTTDFDPGADDIAYAMLVQPDGKILLAGLTGAQYSVNDIALARYNPDGSLDVAFDGDGLYTGAELPGIDGGHALALQTDGKILVGSPSEYPSDLKLVRFYPDGSLDTSFGEGGIVTTDWGCNEDPYGIALQPDGKIVVAGKVQCIHDASVILARYHPDGSLDESFGNYGQVLTDIPETIVEEASALAFQSDGKIVLVGMSHDGYDVNFTVLRYK